MIADMMAEYGGRLLVAVAGVGLGLICLVAVLKYLRQRNGSSPFVRGGRTRAPRLQIVDATAVDTRRRLVLVRRDDVEHLIMIGGPTDIVIESAILARTGVSTSQPIEENNEASEPLRPLRIPEPERSFAPMPLTDIPPQRQLAERTVLERPVAPAPTRTVRPPAEKPLERPLPITPQAAYSEAADDDLPPPPMPIRSPEPAPRPTAAQVPQSGETAALKAAEEQLEAMKRRSQAVDATPRPRAEAEKPSGFAQVLGDEMKTPLPEVSRPVPKAIQQVTRREPATPPAAPEKDPNLQDEIARIFGEQR